jgi:hypothetical protein
MPPFPVGVAGVPVLDGAVLDLGIVERDQLDHRGVELVLVAHRRGAAFEVGDVAALVGDDERALELAGIGGVDAEIGAELHRAAHALRNVDEGAVGEDRRVEAGEEIVARGHDRAEIFPNQVRKLPDRLGDGAEDDAGALQLGAEGGGDGDAVEHRVDRDLARALDAGEHLLLLDRDAELGVDAQDFGIDLVEAAELGLLLGLGVIIGILEIDRRDVELGPARPPPWSARRDRP